MYKICTLMEKLQRFSNLQQPLLNLQLIYLDLPPPSPPLVVLHVPPAAAAPFLLILLPQQRTQRPRHMLRNKLQSPAPRVLNRLHKFENTRMP